MPNKQAGQAWITLEVSLLACHSEDDAVDEFRRYVLRQFGISIGHIDAFIPFAGDQHNYCMTLSDVRIYLASDSLTEAFLAAANELAKLLWYRLQAIFEAIDADVLTHYYQQLSQPSSHTPSINKLIFCRRYLNVNNPLAMMACLLASGLCVNDVQQQLGISRTTRRTYLQRLAKQCRVDTQQQLILHLTQGPLAWLQ